MNEDNKLGWLRYVAMVVVAALFDVSIIVADIVLFGAGFLITWIPSLVAILTFGLWFALKGEANYKRIAILVAPFVGGCAGFPGWTAAIWWLVAKIIAEKTLSQLAPAGLEKVASVIKKI
ncbi:MAG: hypothetical protein AAB505_02190 [Patescibacteria group bacterium]